MKKDNDQAEANPLTAVEMQRGVMHEVLCQDCLKTKPYSDERHSGLEQCECGGDFCGCGSCTDAIKELRSGELTAKKLNIQGGDLLSWTPEAGFL